MKIEYKNTLAILIGISTYRTTPKNILPSPVAIGEYSKLQDLPQVHENLHQIRWCLREIAELPASHIVEIRDQTVGEISTHFIAALDQFVDAQEEPSKACLVLYYCGHGVRSSDSVPKLLLTGSDTEADEKLWEPTTFSYEWVRQRLNEKKLGQVFIILDCCNAGRSISGSPMIQTADDIENKNGVFILSAVQAGKSALALEQLGMSAFTSALVLAMKEGKADSVNRMLSLGDLYDLSLDKVQSIRQKYNFTKKQLPDPTSASSGNSASLEVIRNQACERLHIEDLSHFYHQQVRKVCSLPLIEKHLTDIVRQRDVQHPNVVNIGLELIKKLVDQRSADHLLKWLFLKPDLQIYFDLSKWRLKTDEETITIQDSGKVGFEVNRVFEVTGQTQAIRVRCTSEAACEDSRFVARAKFLRTKNEKGKLVTHDPKSLRWTKQRVVCLDNGKTHKDFVILLDREMNEKEEVTIKTEWVWPDFFKELTEGKSDWMEWNIREFDVEPVEDLQIEFKLHKNFIEDNTYAIECDNVDGECSMPRRKGTYSVTKWRANNVLERNLKFTIKPFNYRPKQE